MAVKLEVENEQLLREEVMKMLLLFNCVILIFFLFVSVLVKCAYIILKAITLCSIHLSFSPYDRIRL